MFSSSLTLSSFSLLMMPARYEAIVLELSPLSIRWAWYTSRDNSQDVGGGVQMPHIVHKSPVGFHVVVSGAPCKASFSSYNSRFCGTGQRYSGSCTGSFCAPGANWKKCSNCILERLSAIPFSLVFMYAAIKRALCYCDESQQNHASPTP